MVHENMDHAIEQHGLGSLALQHSQHLQSTILAVAAAAAATTHSLSLSLSLSLSSHSQ
jgi:hypothetical protein